MKEKFLNTSHSSYGWMIVLTVFLLGLYFTVIQPLGPKLSRLPGDLGDTRFNNYILEHNYRWVTGKDHNLWDVPMYFPYKNTLAFGDNHLGSSIFYFTFRFSGISRESAFQGWYLLSFLLNYWTTAFVLSKFNLKPLAIAFGAFLFSFGLPVLAQEIHVQLAYRFCIPLASYSLWVFAQKKDLKYSVLVVFWVVWQFFLNIYLGTFLFMFIFLSILGMPFIERKSIKAYLRYWVDVISSAWEKGHKKNFVQILIGLIFLVALFLLFQPYIEVTKVHRFSRSWQEVAQYLPRIQSYFTSNQSQLWQLIGLNFSEQLSSHWEHQLFIGMASSLLLFSGFFLRFKSNHKSLGILFLIIIGLLFLLTLSIGGFSFYKLLWSFPGINSLRAIGRIILVMLWPIAFIISIDIDALLRLNPTNILYQFLSLLFLGLLISESILFQHNTFSKEDARSRLDSVRARISTTIPDDPVLFVWDPDPIVWYETELDALLLSQDVNWPAQNGYSGNFTPGYGPSQTCDQAATRLTRYMAFVGMNDINFFNTTMSRIVPSGPIDCEIDQNLETLEVTYFNGPFPQELLGGITLKIDSVLKKGRYLEASIRVINHSLLDLPAESASENPFRLSWRITDISNGDRYSGFDARKELVSDIPGGGEGQVTIVTAVPTDPGEFFFEVSAVQENIIWFHDKGMQIERADQNIIVMDENNWIFR